MPQSLKPQGGLRCTGWKGWEKGEVWGGSGGWIEKGGMGQAQALGSGWTDVIGCWQQIGRKG